MKRALAAIFCIMLVLAPCPVAFASPASISVKSESSVRGPWLTLGEIALISGESPERVQMLKELKLGDAPAPGTTAFFTPASLEPKLVATHADFSAITWSVPDNFKVTTLSQLVGGKKIADMAQTYLAQAAVGSTLVRMDSPADLQAPAGQLELTPELSGPVRYSGATTVHVTVRTDGRSFVKVPVRFEVRRYLEVVVAAANLNAGDILSEQSLRLERVDAGKLPAGYLTETGRAVGLQVRYAVPPGSILYEKNLSRPILVQRGEIVRLTSRIGDIEVSAGGVALSQGAAGDLVRVQNSATKRILTGRVQEDKSVLVHSQLGG